MLYSLAKLGAPELEAIKSLEKKTGKILLAFKPYEVDLATLKPEELKQIEQAEEKLGLSLVAVQ